MKSLKRKLYFIYKKWKFLRSEYYKIFKQSTDKKRILLIDTPTHGNLGDQAIAIAEQKFISEKLECNYFEFTHMEYIVGRNELVKSVQEEDIILIHGGGFIGTIWQNEEDILISILKDFKHNKIIIFPQTVFFENTGHGILERKRLYNAIKECLNVKIFVRDKLSYQILTKEMNLPRRQCFLVPDIVTYMNGLEDEIKKLKRTKILFCMRKDKEKNNDDKQILNIYQSLMEAGEDVSFTDTVVERKIEKKEREKEVERKLLEFSSAKIVITDRIHGMLFAAVTGTPCIAMDNISKKVSGAYEWIQYLEYVQFIKDKELTLDIILAVSDKRNCNYSNIKLQKYYELMKKEILS